MLHRQAQIPLVNKVLITLAGSDGPIAVNISDFWSDAGGIGIRGWVSAKGQPPQDIEFFSNGTSVALTSWHRRDDIAEKAPPRFLGMAWGFWCYLPATSTPSVTVRRRGSNARHGTTVQLKCHPRKIPDSEKLEGGGLFEDTYRRRPSG